MGKSSHYQVDVAMGKRCFISYWFIPQDVGWWTIQGWLNDTYLKKMQQYSFVFVILKEDTSLATVDGEKQSGMAI